MVSTFQLGRLTLREDFASSDSVATDFTQALYLSGQESMPRWNADGIVKQREDLLAMQGRFLPAVFAGKSYLNGFYQVLGVSGDINDFIPENLKVFAWTLNLLRIGTDSSVDIESRLSGSEARANNFSSTGERTHAPSIGHIMYYAGAATPSSVARGTTDGTITVYRDVPFDLHPRWAVSPQNYIKGRVRLDDINYERAATGISIDPVNWTLSNGMARLRPLGAGGTFEFAAWAGGAWETKVWDVLVGTSPVVNLAPFNYCTVLKNDFEAVTLRMSRDLAPGRVMVDVTLRRGSRIIEIFVQTMSSTTIKTVLHSAESSSNGTGFVIATANDASGNKAVTGSAKTATQDLVNGGLSKAGTLEFDAYIGLVVDGSSAVSGDTGTDLREQYIGMPTESVRGVSR